MSEIPPPLVKMLLLYQLMVSVTFVAMSWFTAEDYQTNARAREHKQEHSMQNLRINLTLEYLRVNE